MPSASKSCARAAPETPVFFEADEPPFDASTPVVLKIGGSLIRRSETLTPVLDIVDRARRPLAIVAGGGAFADAVREAQSRLGFDDRTAHRMAILALHQNAIIITSRVARLRPVETLEEVRAVVNAGESAIWLPLKECEADTELPSSWDTTSDAIAARLAERLGGVPLVLLKSRQPMGSRKPHCLAAEGLIDPVSVRILRRSNLPFTLIEAPLTSHLARLLGAPETVDAANDP